MKKVADTILMIRPAAFGFNSETAANNVFQSVPTAAQSEIQQKAVEEFDNFVATLRGKEIEVIVIEDTQLPLKPDAVFPNNWFCTLEDGTVATFPMYAANRRVERRADLVDALAATFAVSNREDWSKWEAQDIFLEGTGSMIMDHENKIIYACLSPRTNKELLEKFAATHNYKAVSFFSRDENGIDVYHTNVIMHLGKGYAVICLESLDKKDRIVVTESLKKTGHEIIDITLAQVKAFAGNMLQVKSKNGKFHTILSQLAFMALTAKQKNLLGKYTELLPVSIPVIETIGGGSVRCMMAEIYLEKR